MSSRLDDLPDELLLDSILPLLPVSDLLSVSQTNRHISQVASDQTFWKRKIRADFNLPPSVTARQDGWKELYAALRRPSLFVWGDSSNCRLGLPRSHPAFTSFHADYNGLNEPALLSLDPSVGLVDIQASGFGFVGLDSAGNVWVWGTLDGTQYPRRSNPDWLLAGSISDQPRQLALTGIRSISCGRRHFLALGKDDTVWELTAWGKAKKMTTSTNAVSRAMAQVSAGWDHSAGLSFDGSEISVWYPSFAAVGTAGLYVTETINRAIPNDSREDGISVAILSEEIVPFTLPPIRGSTQPHGMGERVIEIACGESFVLALTEGGKLWSCWVGSRLDEIGSLERGSSKAFWEEHPQFQHPRAEDGEKITHISAHFQSFFAYSPGSTFTDRPYSTSLVSKGSRSDLRFSHDDGASPEIINDLQGRGVISVAVGDYHAVALTVRGEVFSWGQYSNGALGLGKRGHRGSVEVPTQVSFDGHDATFAFAITASGWHTGALTVNLDSSQRNSTNRAEDIDPDTDTEIEAAFINSTSARLAQMDPVPSGRPIPGGSSHPSSIQPAPMDAELGEGPAVGRHGVGLPVGMRGIRIGFAGRGGTRGANSR